MADWDTLGVPYELLTPDEIRYRWPVIGSEGAGVGLYEPGAGVVRSRRAIEAVVEVFRKEGGPVTIAAAEMGARDGRQLNALNLQLGEQISAATYIFACGPWFPKVFPELMGKRLRISMGTPSISRRPPRGQQVFVSQPSELGFPGCHGWARARPRPSRLSRSDRGTRARGSRRQ